MLRSLTLRSARTMQTSASAASSWTLLRASSSTSSPAAAAAASVRTRSFLAPAAAASSSSSSSSSSSLSSSPWSTLAHHGRAIHSVPDGPPPKTAIVMLNMGGPEHPKDTGAFLHNLFTDGEIVELGAMQPYLGPFLAKRRTPEIQKQYESIGGSPIRKWTDAQGVAMCKKLDALSPATAPHKHYIAFRYAEPSTESAIEQMSRDGVTRAVAFSQYPQYSCTTTGSSLNHLWRELERLNVQNAFRWSVLDRWDLSTGGFVRAVADRIKTALANFPEESRDRTIIQFSAHSLPVRIVDRGDQYAQEVAATVQSVMTLLEFSNPYVLSWQSQVGRLQWQGPKTEDVLTGLGRQGHQQVCVVPIAFTSDHIETLFEIDVEYAHVASEAGITHFHRAESLNDSELLTDAQADMLHRHLRDEQLCTTQYRVNCANCARPWCRTITNPIRPYHKFRDLNEGRNKVVF